MKSSKIIVLLITLFFLGCSTTNTHSTKGNSIDNETKYQGKPSHYALAGCGVGMLLTANPIVCIATGAGAYFLSDSKDKKEE